MNNIYQHLSADLKEKFRSIKLLILDFDGVITNNKVYVTQEGIETVQADRGDGLGLEYLRKHAKVEVLILSKETNPVTVARAKKLGIPCIASLDSKIDTFNRELRRRMLTTNEVCYVGNDINDIECMKQAGLSVAVSDSYEQVLSIAQYVTLNKGGNGAVREVCELIMYAKETHPCNGIINTSSLITKALDEAIELKQKIQSQNVGEIEQIIELVIQAYKNGHKLILMGNGGSAADCQHIAGEFVGRFKQERKALPALALNTNSSVLTALSNDYSYDIIFARQIEALGNAGDIVWGISTSGNSPNILEGLKKAKDLGLKTVGFSGGDGGKMLNLCDVCFAPPSTDTPRIQEAHITVAHIICELVEKKLFSN